MKKYNIIIVISIILNLFLGVALMFAWKNQPKEKISYIEVIKPVPIYIDLFDVSSELTGVPVEILKGIAYTESRFIPKAVGDNGKSLGMFQINEQYRQDRIWKYGEYDPFDPLQSAIVAGKILKTNYKVLDNWEHAVSAYNQGIEGFKKNGVREIYVNSVKNWRTRFIAEK